MYWCAQCAIPAPIRAPFVVQRHLTVVRCRDERRVSFHPLRAAKLQVSQKLLSVRTLITSVSLVGTVASFGD